MLPPHAKTIIARCFFAVPLVLVVLAVGALALPLYRLVQDDKLYASDPEFVLRDRTPSPDGRHVILSYVVDVGALGYSRTRTAVVPAKHDQLDLREYQAARPYRFVRWLDSGELVVEESELHPDPDSGHVLASGDSLFGHRVYMVSALPSSLSTVW